MIKEIYLQKKTASNWFGSLQEILCYEFEKLEIEYAKNKFTRPHLFKKKIWKKSINKNLGGGISYLIKDGFVFDKIGINFSEVSGKFEKKFKNQILGANKNPNYWASGISVVAHMKNPKIPALHFNTRHIVTSKNWFGGGIDATQSFKDIVEKKFFHKNIKKICDKHNKTYYLKYKKWCDKYFFLKHRNETRGIGGIFYDYKMKNWKKDFDFTRDVGLCFVDTATRIIRNKMYTKWTKKEKKNQLIKRGRYIEFNLLYDRGTKFGLNTGGDTESILMSIPPLAKWI